MVPHQSMFWHGESWYNFEEKQVLFDTSTDQYREFQEEWFPQAIVHIEGGIQRDKRTSQQQLVAFDTALIWTQNYYFAEM
jgi:hypothetical protein